MDDDHPEAMWPALPRGTRDRRVIAPIFGAYHAARHRLEGAAREHGLDATEAMVLEAIRLEPLCAPWGIRRRLGFARSTMTSVLDRLERDGRLVRGGANDFGQRFALELTASGDTAADLAAYVIGSLEDEIAGYTSPAERRGAVAVFEACMALDRVDRPHP